MPAKRPSPAPKPAARPAAAKPPVKPSARAPKPAAAAAKPVAAKRIDPARPPASAKSVSSPAQRWALVTAKDIMRTDVVTVSYAAPLSEVEQVLADNKISGAPVVDEKGAIIGVVSLKDLVERYAEDQDARPRRGHGFFHLSSEETLDEDFDSFEVPEEAEETARDVMTATVYTVPATAGLKEIATVLCKHKVHRVLVEEGGRLVGLISTIDILDALRA
jgi:CBS domain-containing protein